LQPNKITLEGKRVVIGKQQAPKAHLTNKTNRGRMMGYHVLVTQWKRQKDQAHTEKVKQKEKASMPDPIEVL
jgi:hypothetical protein